MERRNETIGTLLNEWLFLIFGYKKEDLYILTLLSKVQKEMGLNSKIMMCFHTWAIFSHFTVLNDVKDLIDNF